MISADDLTQMQADLALTRTDNAVSIVIRRGATTLSAQTVRVVKSGGAGKGDSGQAEETHGGVVVLGTTSLNIQVEDRFNTGGLLYRVTFVDPNRLVATTAEAELVE